MKKLLLLSGFIFSCLGLSAEAPERKPPNQQQYNKLHDVQKRKKMTAVLRNAPLRNTNNKTTVLDSIVEKSVGGDILSKYVYSYVNDQTLEEYYIWSGLNWIGSSKNVYEYDSATGNPTLLESYYPNGLDWIGSYKNINTYDSTTGRPTLEESYSWDSGSDDWILTYKSTYDSYGRSTLEESYSWDGVNLTGNSKNIKTYDSTTGIRTSSESYSWDSGNNDWILTDKSTYDSYGRSTLLESYYRDGLNWIGSYKNINTYDSTTGRSTLEESYSWDSDSNDWIGSSKNVYEYDSATGIQILSESYYWDNGNNDWILTDKSTCDSYGRSTLSESYYWDGVDLTGNSKSIRTYDSTSGLPTLEESYYWDSGSNDWIMTYKSTYDSYGRSTLSESYNWDGVDLTGNSKDIKTYDSNSGRLTLEEFYSWDSGSNDWILTGNYTYDSYGRLTLSESYYWDGVDWIGYSKNINTYDSTSGLPTLSEFYSWDSDNNDWLLQTISTYYYTDDVVSLADGNSIAKLEIRFAKESFTISGLSDNAGKLLLSDLSGRVLKDTTLIDNDSVNTSDLPDGVYAVRVESGDKTIETKFVKR